MSNNVKQWSKSKANNLNNKGINKPISLQARADALRENLAKRKEVKLAQAGVSGVSVAPLSLVEQPKEEQIIITGGIALKGSVVISGAKNAALPIICASILANNTITLLNVPKLSDITTITSILSGLNSSIVINDEKITISTKNTKNTTANKDLAQKMRASILVLGPLVARYGRAKVSLPGGCAIGERPVDLHLSALEQMGAKIEISEDGVLATAKDGLTGANIKFAKVSVGATENIVMAASIAKGVSVLENCAIEPEIVDLCNFLVKMGAKIAGIGTQTLTITGVASLNNAVKHSIIADRIEAGSYAVAALATKGSIELQNVSKNIFSQELEILKKMGGVVEFVNDTTLKVEYKNELKAIGVETNPYPEFPTDLQSPLSVLMCLANGVSTLKENLFENRFKHVVELQKIGANISIKDNVLTINTIKSFTQSASLIATDLRASFALIIAALNNPNECKILKLEYLDRGYSNVVLNLKQLGANINRKEIN